MSWADRQKAAIAPLAMSKFLPEDRQTVDMAYVPIHLNPVLLVVCFINGSCALYTSLDLVRLMVVQFRVPKVELFALSCAHIAEQTRHAWVSNCIAAV